MNSSQVNASCSRMWLGVKWAWLLPRYYKRFKVINQNINPNKLYINGSRLKFKSSPENEGLDRAMISAINFWWTLLMCFTFFAIQRKIFCRLLNIWFVRWSKCDKLIWSSTFRKANDWKRSEGGDSFNPQTTLEFPMIILSWGNISQCRRTFFMGTT